MKDLALSVYNSRLPFKVRNSIYKNTKLKIYKYSRMFNNGDEILQCFDKYKCIFVHIPKTGGISIKQSLFNCYSPLPHFGVSDYRLIFGKAAFEEYFKFAFVRNPWCRVLSAYLFLKKGGCTTRDKQWSKIHLAKYNTFNDFALVWLNKINIYTQIHFIPQSHFIYDNEGKTQINHVAYFENIEKEFEYLRKIVNPNAQLQHLNKTSSKKIRYQDYYTPQTRKIVADLYQKDISLLKYKFD